MSTDRSLVGDYPEFALTEKGLGVPYVDKDEWQEKRHKMRVIHGGFHDSDTRFQFYFPENARFAGRMVHFLEGGFGGHENVLAASDATAWLFDFAFDEAGAYLVESNQGHFPEPGAGFVGELQNFGASAESARFSWYLAEKLFGSPPHHCYVFGASGGGCRSMSAIEYRPDVWDGAVPHVAPSGGRVPFWAAAYFWLTCKHKMPLIIDALAPGGSGNPVEGLTIDEAEGLACAFSHGLPRGAVKQVYPTRVWTNSVAVDGQNDPYFNDFWTKPGYVGHDAPERLAKYLVGFDTRVKSLVSTDDMTQKSMATRFAAAGAAAAFVAAITLEDVPEDILDLLGAVVTIKSGKAAGRQLPITEITGNQLGTSPESNIQMWSGVEPGDEVHVDNRAFVALCHKWMHELDMAEECRDRKEWQGLSRWRIDGRLMFPQLPVPALGPGEPPEGHSGRFKGKVIQINCTHDGITWPTAALSWTRKIEHAQGADIDSRYRLWWGEHMAHVEPQLQPLLTGEKDPGVWDAQLVRYDGLTEEALRSLIKWVEHSQAPLASTRYHISESGEIQVPPTADERGGPQPIVTVTANGAARADVRVGEPVTLLGRAVQPKGAGSIVSTSWDLEGAGRQTGHQIPDRDTTEIEVEYAHAFDKPGTHFVTFRAIGHSDGLDGKGLGVENIARCRIVVTA